MASSCEEHLVVATGALGKPKIAADASALFDEHFSGRDAAPLRVLRRRALPRQGRAGAWRRVVRGGIAVDLARAADSTVMSIRGDVDWVFPRHGAFGESLRLCGGDDAPLWVRNLAARATFRLKHGKLAEYGMQPKGAPLNRRIVVSDEFYPLIAHGDPTSTAAASRASRVTSSRSRTAPKHRFDAVVLCNGYDIATSASAHPYLKEHLASVARIPEDGKPAVYLGAFLPEVENCSFIGGCFGFVAVPRIAELQAKAP